LHEFSIASSMVELVLKEAEKKRATRVVEVHLVVGKLTFIALEQIRFSYRILAKDTILEGSRLRIEQKEGLGECGSCKYKGPIECKDDPLYHISFPSLSCPKCGSTLRIVDGKECLVKSVRMVC
jgi:hydrogenase nickel incorporation protein HypA/HybF